MKEFLARLFPFLMMGFILVVLIAGIVIFSYLLILGAVVGLVLFGLAWLRDKFLPNKHLIKRERKGRTFDHDK